jgi:hypothetical protein
MTPPKTLLRHVQDRSWRADRHADLLDGPVLPWPTLAALQARYIRARTELERRAVALEFSQAIRRPLEEELELRARKLQTPAGFLYAGIGPDAGDVDLLGFRRRGGSVDWAAFDRLVRRWTWWNRRHGTYWRARQHVLHNLDAIKLHKILTGERTRLVNDARRTVAEHAERVAQLIAERQPIPDPPGFELLPAAGPRR